MQITIAKHYSGTFIIMIINSKDHVCQIDDLAHLDLVGEKEAWSRAKNLSSATGWPIEKAYE